MKAARICKTCRSDPLHLRQNSVSIHLRYATRKRKDDLEKWPHVMRNIFGNFNGLQSNNRPQGVSVLWFGFILKVGRTNFSIPLSRVPHNLAFPAPQVEIAPVGWLPTQISRQVTFSLSGCSYYRYVQCKKYRKLQKDILARNIFYLERFYDAAILKSDYFKKGDPVASEPLWLTTVTMLSPSLLLQLQSLLKSQS